MKMKGGFDQVRQFGFSLIELMIVLSMVMIVVVMVGAGVNMNRMEWKDIMSGVVCKAGYKFSRDVNGYDVQIADIDGRAIPCK